MPPQEVDLTKIPDSVLAQMAGMPGPLRGAVALEQHRREQLHITIPDPGAAMPIVGTDAGAVRQQFLADQAWSALTPQQQQVVTAHADAQVALSVATQALSDAAKAQTAAQDQMTTVTTAVQDAAAKAQAVVAALPPQAQAQVAHVAAQVPQLVDQVQQLAASVDQVTTATTDAQASLTTAQQAVTDAVVQAVTQATAPGASPVITGTVVSPQPPLVATADPSTGATDPAVPPPAS